MTKAIKKAAKRKTKTVKNKDQYAVLGVWDNNVTSAVGPFDSADKAHAYAVGGERVVKLSQQLNSYPQMPTAGGSR